LSPEVYCRLTSERQVACMSKSVEGRYATHVKSSAGESLQSEDQAIGVHRLRGTGKDAASEWYEPITLHVFPNELPREAFGRKPSGRSRYPFRK
jgi:hypothetical protein